DKNLIHIQFLSGKIIFYRHRNFYILFHAYLNKYPVFLALLLCRWQSSLPRLAYGTDQDVLQQ
ncbi:hypothetical protein, partial [Robinsoniella peoriensis]